MAIDRRSFAELVTAALPAAVLGPSRGAAATPPRLLGAWQSPKGGYGAGSVDGNATVALPGRGHDIALAPDGTTAVVFGRRPGFFALAIGLAGGGGCLRIDSPPGRHFYGHGAFSADGALLFATENAFETGEGRIAVLDATDGFRRIDDWPSHGIGPHDMALGLGGRTLIVANGGVMTHPSRDREKLNLDTMAPSLALLDATDGRLLAEARPARELQRLSIRHVAQAPDGLIAAGMQWEGDPLEPVPLVATWDGAGGLAFCDPFEPANLALAGYTGAVSFDPSGTTIAATSPQGHAAGLWRRDDLAPLASLPIPEVCGLCPGDSPGSVILSSGLGGLWSVEPDGTMAALDQGGETRLWDNHLRRL